MGTNRETKGRGLQLPVSESSISPNSVFKPHAVEEQGSPAHEHLEAVHRGKGRDSETEKATGQTSRPDFSSARPPPKWKVLGAHQNTRTPHFFPPFKVGLVL